MWKEFRSSINIFHRKLNWNWSQHQQCYKQWPHRLCCFKTAKQLLNFYLAKLKFQFWEYPRWRKDYNLVATRGGKQQGGPSLWINLFLCINRTILSFISLFSLFAEFLHEYLKKNEWSMNSIVDSKKKRGMRNALIIFEHLLCLSRRSWITKLSRNWTQIDSPSEMSLSSHISWESNFPNFDQNF